MSKRPRGRPKGSRGGAAILTREQAREVLKSARRSARYSDRAEIAFMLSIEFGLRAGELSALTIGDLFEQDGRTRAELGLPSGRKISAPRRPSRELRTRLADYRERNFGPAPNLGDPLFRSQRGDALTRASLGRLITSLYRKAGVLGGSSRSGRRTMLAQMERVWSQDRIGVALIRPDP